MPELKTILNQALSLWRTLPLPQRVSLVFAAGFILAVMTGVFLWSHRPDMQLLYGRLSDKDAAEIARQLEVSGIPYRMGIRGDSIEVPSRHVQRARMDLAVQGIPSGGTVGFEIFDKGNFGVSDFVQRTNFMRALTGELARTIENLDGVEKARVMVVMPENRLLLTDDSKRPTASVFVDSGPRRLEPGAVQAIRSLVANAVERLRPEDVVVVDHRGAKLSESLGEGASGAGQTKESLRQRQVIEAYLTEKLETLLGTVLGPGNAVCRVSVDLDTSSSVIEEERFDPESAVLRSMVLVEDSSSSRDGGATAVVGVGGNTPETADPTQTGRATSSQHLNRTREESFEINRIRSNIVRNPGEIRNISASVFVAMRTTGQGDARTSLPRTEQELEALRQIVVNALGIRPQRNQPLSQFVTLVETEFAPDGLQEQWSHLERQHRLDFWINSVKTGLSILAVLGVLVFFLHMLRRNPPEDIALALAPPQEEPGRPSLLPDHPVTPELLNELIRQKPANVGITLKDWISDEALNDR